ncbi:unnamed protein product [Moneuplotes crassus]|uniref:Uncharacterized protein n=1 Tax=Euplotes crassus TaxID=5936 RepID=A0AAD1XZM4_EUPCR|nr:unnamed protein product [Moneuplotes crassus]
MESSGGKGFHKVVVSKENKGLKKFVNDIFESNGYPRVKKFAKEFSNGKLFLLLFNLIFDESLSLPFSGDSSVESKLQNWNKINAMICFNYLQQDFYFGAATMTTLAKGDSPDTLCHVLRLLLNSSQVHYEDAIVDEAGKADISDVLIAASESAGMGPDTKFVGGFTDPTAQKIS